jgi:hypothetical protein
MKTSKIKSVQANGTFEGNYGTMYKFEYQMEDGTILVANHKTPEGAFKVGEEVEYEITRTNEYGNQGKVKRPQPEGAGFGGGFSGGNKRVVDNEAIMYQVAIKCATELFAHKGITMPTPAELCGYAFEVAQQAQKHIEALKK